MPDHATDRLFRDLAVHGILDWQDTPLGHPSLHSAALQLAIVQMTEASFPACIAFGAARRLIYNPAFAGLIGDQHPA